MLMRGFEEGHAVLAHQPRQGHPLPTRSDEIDPHQLIQSYGYAGVAFLIGLESMGVPAPGEAALIAAATYAGATAANAEHLNIGLVILAAVGGAVVGDSIGYWIGREVGFRLLLRYGARIGLGEGRLKLGQYLFLRHGGKIVFIGRFVAFLRVAAAVLAGANRMSWPRFLLFNAAGAIAWASVVGLGAYTLGASIDRLSVPFGLLLFGIAASAMIGGLILLRRREREWTQAAERALPGPLRRRRGPTP